MIEFIQRYALLGLGVALALALVALLERQFELMRERAALANEHAAREQERADAADLARTWQAATFRAYEAAMRDRGAALEKIDALSLEIRRQQARIDALGLDRDKLRADLAAFAAGDPGDTLAACVDRARVLAVKLGEGAELIARARDLGGRFADLARESAEKEERNAAALNACVAAWPRATPATTADIPED